MRKFCVTAGAVLLVAGGLVAAHENHAKAKTGATALDRLKALQGEWTGTASHDGSEPMPAKVSYRVTGGGSAVVETLFEGTPHEMVSVYYTDGNDLVMTHYCAMGNQPRMRVRNPSADGTGDLAFAFDGGTNINGGHMDNLKITFKDADHIRAVWQAVDDAGKPDHTATLDVARAK